VNAADVDTMADDYMTSALWTGTDGSTDAGGEPLDDTYGPEDIAPESQAAMRRDCEAFYAANVADLEPMDAGQAGHDLWLTRNGHGTGFWDRGLGERGDRLADAARLLGEKYVVIGDDGRLHYEG
jgi:hypothetical protein